MQTLDSRGHVPSTRKWAFDDGVASCFPDMLRRSVPQYDVMRDAVFTLGERFVQPNTDVIDLGASRGDALEPFVSTFGAQNRFVAVEVSPPMLAALHERFSGYESTGVVQVTDTDLRVSFPRGKASLILSVLTLQFVPIEYRQRIVSDIYRTLIPGGALVLVEKVLGRTSKLNALFVDRYYDLKRANGYSQEEIDRKRLALEGVLVPVAAHWNVEMLEAAGFSEIDCFWRWMNFGGWLAVK